MPTINLRATHVSVGTQFSGLRVPNKALYTVDGQTGRVCAQWRQLRFYSRNRNASDSEYSLIEPVNEGAVYSGMSVVIR